MLKGWACAHPSWFGGLFLCFGSTSEQPAEHQPRGAGPWSWGYTGSVSPRSRCDLRAGGTRSSGSCRDEEVESHPHRSRRGWSGEQTPFLLPHPTRCIVERPTLRWTLLRTGGAEGNPAFRSLRFLGAAAPNSSPSNPPSLIPAEIKAPAGSSVPPPHPQLRAAVSSFSPQSGCRWNWEQGAALLRQPLRLPLCFP